MPRVLTRRATAFRAPTHSPPPPVTEELDARITVHRRHPALTELGIPEWLVETFELGISTDPQRLSGRLIFPVRNAAGKLVGYAGRWATETVPANRAAYRYVGKVEAEVFNLNEVLAVHSDLPLVVVTDPFDVLPLRRYFESVVALVGDELNEVQLRRLSYHFPRRSLLVLCDETNAGRKRRHELVRRLSPFHPVRAPEFLTDGRTVRSLTLTELKEEL
jgi:hypothetical protein